MTSSHSYIYIYIYPCHSWSFVCKSWLSVREDDGRIRRHFVELNWDPRYSIHIRGLPSSVFKRHLVGAVFRRHSRSKYTCTQRVGILFMMLCLIMVNTNLLHRLPRSESFVGIVNRIYPWPISARWYCRALRHRSLFPSVRPSVRFSLCPGQHSTVHDTKQILFIFGTAINLNGNMNSLEC